MVALFKWIRTWAEVEAGQAVAEYALVLTLVVLTATTGLSALGLAIAASLDQFLRALPSNGR